MASRIRSLRQINRRSLLDNFLLRESPASAATGLSTIPGPFAGVGNPFAPTKAEGSRSWTAPRWSARRQKVLRTLVEARGWPENVLPVTPVRAEPVRAARTLRGSTHIPKTSVLNELDLERKGPYVGRSGPAFKGKMWERKMKARTEELRVALEATTLKEIAWRKVRPPALRSARADAATGESRREGQGSSLTTVLAMELVPHSHYPLSSIAPAYPPPVPPASPCSSVSSSQRSALFREDDSSRERNEIWQRDDACTFQLLSSFASVEKANCESLSLVVD